MSETRWKGYIGIGEDLNVDVLDDVYYFGVNTFNWKPEPSINKASEAIGKRSVQRETLTALTAPGSFEFEANPETLGRVLKYAMRNAAPAVTDNLDGSYLHEYALQDAIAPFYIREVKGGADDIIIGPCKINTLTLAANAAEKLMCTVEFLTASPGYIDAGSFGAAAFPDVQLKPFIFKQLVDKIDDHAAWPATTQDTTWESFSLTINNNLIGDKFSSDGSLYPAETPEDGREISGVFTREFASRQLWLDFLAEQEKMMLAEFTGGIIAGANSYFLKLLMYRAYLTDHDRGADIGGGGGRMVATIPFDCLEDSTEGTELAVELQNTTASYPTP